MVTETQKRNLSVNKARLKIKQKSLAAEVGIIKFELGKILSPKNKEKFALAKHTSLNNHCKIIVSPEARATHIARAFLRGLPFSRVEVYKYEANKATNSPSYSAKYAAQEKAIKRAGELARRYGSNTPVNVDAFEVWVNTK